VANGTPVYWGTSRQQATPTTPGKRRANNGRDATYPARHQAGPRTSTLTVVDRSKPGFPVFSGGRAQRIEDGTPRFDQSVVRASGLWDVLQEAVTAAILVALMVLTLWARHAACDRDHVNSA